MKFLCDVHLPERLVRYLVSKGYEAVHVRSILDGDRTEDVDISSFADEGD